MIVSSEVETVRKEAVVCKFEVLSRKLHRVTELSRGRYQESACPDRYSNLAPSLYKWKSITALNQPAQFSCFNHDCWTEVLKFCYFLSVTTCRLRSSKPTCEQVKGKVIPFHTMKAYSGDVAPLFLNLSTGWRWVTNFTTQPTLPPGKNLGTNWIGSCVGPRTGADISDNSPITFIINVPTCAVAHQAQETYKTVKLQACVPHENPVEKLSPYFLRRNFFPLQSHPLTFFVSVFLLTSLRLDIYLSSPPHSWLTILYLKIWHRPSGSIFIPGHNRNKLKESQYAISVSFTVTCMYHMPDCHGVRS
jgi:hypothetical protein